MVLEIAVAARGDQRGAVGAADQRVDAQPRALVGEPRVAGERQLAAALHAGEERALGLDRNARLAVIERSEQLEQRAIVDARLEAQRALTDRGNALLHLEHLV